MALTVSRGWAGIIRRYTSAGNGCLSHAETGFTGQEDHTGKAPFCIYTSVFEIHGLERTHPHSTAPVVLNSELSHREPRGSGANSNSPKTLPSGALGASTGLSGTIYTPGLGRLTVSAVPEPTPAQLSVPHPTPLPPPRAVSPTGASSVENSTGSWLPVF